MGLKNLVYFPSSPRSLFQNPTSKHFGEQTVVQATQPNLAKWEKDRARAKPVWRRVLWLRLAVALGTVAVAAAVAMAVAVGAARAHTRDTQRERERVLIPM